MAINHFHGDTPQVVREVLLAAQRNSARIRVFYGDQKTGRAWPEENDVIGTVGNSTGPQKIPLIINNARSTGGPALLDRCVVAVRARDGWLYKHPKFTPGVWTVGPADIAGYSECAMHDGEVHARFKKPGQAQRYCDFMTGARFSR